MAGVCDPAVTWRSHRSEQLSAHAPCALVRDPSLRAGRGLPSANCEAGHDGLAPLRELAARLGVGHGGNVALLNLLTHIGRRQYFGWHPQIRLSLHGRLRR